MDRDIILYTFDRQSHKLHCTNPKYTLYRVYRNECGTFSMGCVGGATVIFDEDDNPSFNEISFFDRKELFCDITSMANQSPSLLLKIISIKAADLKVFDQLVNFEWGTEYFT